MALEHEQLTESIIAGAIEVHRHLGPGLLESAYVACLAHELGSKGLTLARQVSLPLEFKGIALDCGYRIDLIDEGAVIVEVKAVERILPVHEAQLLTYLRLSGCTVGLILNFHVEMMRRGIVRKVLSASARSAPSAPPR